MNYTVASDIFEGKKKGDLVTTKELLELGLNIDALVASEHLKKATAPTKPAEETK